jgi:uncharacterized protein YbdZ (MbtH family)
MRGIFGNARVVYAVWPDSFCEGGVGWTVVKGEHLAHHLNDLPKGWDAVRLRNKEEAFAVRSVLGDGKKDCPAEAGERGSVFHGTAEVPIRKPLN